MLKRILVLYGLIAVFTVCGPVYAAQELRPTTAISALENLQRIMASPSVQNVVSTRSTILSQHNFRAGSTVADFFRTNGLAVFFDFPETGSRTIPQPIFFATIGDLVDFLTEILGYRVTMKGRGIYVVSECWEDVYNVPAVPAIRSYFSPKNLVALMEHEKASVRFLPDIGKVYFYDNKRGHQRMADYVRGVIQKLRMEEYLWHKEQEERKREALLRQAEAQRKPSKRHWWCFWRH